MLPRACLLAALAVPLLGCGSTHADAPAADAGPDAPPDAPTCTPDLMRDRKNCGACGHDCLGGVCYAGRCDPVTLAGDLDGLSAMTLNGAYVYFAYAGHVARVPVAGGPVEDLSTQTFTAQRLAVDDTSVYVATGSDVVAFPKAGDAMGAAARSVVSARGRALAVDATSVFFQVPAGLASAPKSGDAGAPLLLAPLGSDTVNDVATDDADVFFTSMGAGTVKRVAKSGAGDAGAATLAAMEASPTDVAVDATFVYYTSTGAVRKIPKAGGPPSDFVAGLGKPRAIAVDAARVYWTDEVKGDVSSCPLAGCAGGIELHAHVMDPTAVAVDPVAIYIADYRGRAVMRVAR